MALDSKDSTIGPTYGIVGPPGLAEESLQPASVLYSIVKQERTYDASGGIGLRGISVRLAPVSVLMA